METFNNLFVNVLMFALLMIPGFIMGKRRRIDSDAVHSFGNLLSDVAMPALVFFKLLETDIRKIAPLGLLCSALLPVGVVGLVSLLSVPVFSKQKDPMQNPVSRFCSVYSNCGFLGIPLASAMYPDQPEITLYVSIFNVVSTFLLLSFGARTLSGTKGKVHIWRFLLQPITVCIAVGTMMSFLGVGQRIPEVVTYASTLSQLTTPLSMTVLGFQLSGLRVKKMLTHPYVYLTAFLKLIVSPLVALGLLLLLNLLPGVSVCSEVAVGMCIATAVSTAASAPALSGQYGLDGEYAASLTLGNTLLCALTLPAVYCLFNLFFPM